MKKVLIITDEKKSSYNQCDALLYYLNKKVKLKTKYLKIERTLIHTLPNFVIYIYLIIKSFLEKKNKHHIVDFIKKFCSAKKNKLLFSNGLLSSSETKNDICPPNPRTNLLPTSSQCLS